MPPEEEGDGAAGLLLKNTISLGNGQEGNRSGRAAADVQARAKCALLRGSCERRARERIYKRRGIRRVSGTGLWLCL
jgi:hypothetical protein